MSYIAAVDAGASEIKACIFDLNGKEVSSSSRDCHKDSPQTGWAQISSGFIKKFVFEVLKEAIASKNISEKNIQAIGVTGSRATIAPFMKDGQSVGPLIFWYDRRAKNEVKEIGEKYGMEDFFNVTGIPLDPTPSITKIIWWKNNHRNLFDSTQIYALPQTIVINSLTGEGWYCDESNGSYLGFMNLRTRSWEKDLMDLAEIQNDKLPKLLKPGTIVGNLSKSAASQIGLDREIPVVISGSDSACFKLGAGVKDKNVASMYIGTAGVTGIINDKPIVDPRLTCCPAAIPNHWDIDGLILSGGSALRWLSDIFNDLLHKNEQLNFKRLDEFADKIPAGSDGVTFVPHLAGSGSPIWNPDSCGIISGLRLSHGAYNIVRAVMEGVVFAELHALEAVKEHVPNIQSLQLTGGGGSSKVWPQIMADAIGLPVTVPESQHSTCLGAAMMASVATGIYSNYFEAIELMTTTQRMIIPNSEFKEIYNTAYKKYLDVIQTT